MPWQLAVPGLLVLVEVCALTPWVEFHHGPVQYVADPNVCAGLVFAAVAFCVAAPPGGLLGRWRWRWLLLHALLLAAFVVWSLHLSGSRPSAYPALAAAAWIVLAGGVGLTALLTACPAAALWPWLWQRRAAALLAAGLGAALALATPFVQSFWPDVHRPATALDRLLLQWTYGAASLAVNEMGYPILQVPNLRLLITPQCSGLEALAAFWLLALAVDVARGPQLWQASAAVGLLLGTALLCLLLALRLYALVIIGVAVSPAACVGLAHSRIGTVIFLGVAVALLAGLTRGRRRAPA